MEVSAVTAGTVTGTDTATHWALTDGAAILVATGALDSSQALTSGNSWECAAFKLTARDVA